MPADERNDAERNPDVYSSDLPIFTTDVRMEKAGEVIKSAPGASGNEDLEGSGGGGPIEAVWWIEETGTQWRVRGDAWIIHDSDIEDGGAAAQKVRDAIESRMRMKGQGAAQEWSWKKEVGVVFGAQSPGIKGSFRQPTPGKLVGKKQDGYEVGMKIDDLNDEIARRNFRVVVIRPFEVEVTDLSDPEKARRQYYTYQEDGDWKHQTLWP
jgi:pyridoxamine 5'-phosphate oxidase